jgi:hypothetical protein
MSHVDEGTLHAYLDGELPSGERAALESHLAQCATCRTQLAEERALLERSTALLGSTRPLERAVPPFEQLRRAPRRRWYMRTGFAWAASLILAVGFGYYLSDRVSPRSLPAAVDKAPVASQGAESLHADAQVAARQRQENAPAQKSTAGRRPVAHTAPAAENSYDVRRDSNAMALATQPPSAVTLRGQAASPLPLDTSRRLRDSARLEEAVVTAAPQEGASNRAAEVPSANRSDSRSVRNLVSTTWPLISRGKAASLLGDRPVGVPGLATRGIHSSPTGDGTVVVEQALDSKTVIQIFQRTASSAEADELTRERADRVLARYVGRLRVEISGPVSTDSLNKLLEQLEPIP